MNKKEIENYYFCKDKNCSKKDDCKRFIENHEDVDASHNKFYIIRREHNFDCFEELGK